MRPRRFHLNPYAQDERLTQDRRHSCNGTCPVSEALCGALHQRHPSLHPSVGVVLSKTHAQNCHTLRRFYLLHICPSMCPGHLVLPQNALTPRYCRFDGTTSSRSDVQQRKASLPIRRILGRSQTSTRATQYEKVEPQMAMISVHIRSTSIGRLQFSHAIGPRKLKSGGRRRLSMPAPQKLPSGRARVLSSWDITNSTVVNARQLSKAKGAICAPGASALVAPLPSRRSVADFHGRRNSPAPWQQGVCRLRFLLP